MFKEAIGIFFQIPGVTPIFAVALLALTVMAVLVLTAEVAKR